MSDVHYRELLTRLETETLSYLPGDTAPRFDALADEVSVATSGLRLLSDDDLHCLFSDRPDQRLIARALEKVGLTVVLRLRALMPLATQVVELQPLNTLLLGLLGSPDMERQTLQRRLV